MSKKIPIDATLRDQLANAEGEVTLTGPDGKALGVYTPMSEIRYEPEIDEAESQRRMADKTSKRYSTAEVLAMLEKL